MFRNKIILTTLVGESTIINGNIESKSSIKIDGIVNGNIESKSDIYISKTSTVNGKVTSINGNIIINGKVIGDVKGISLTLGNKSIVTGDISVKNINIEKGSILNSSINMEIIN